MQTRREEEKLGPAVWPASRQSRRLELFIWRPPRPGEVFRGEAAGAGQSEDGKGGGGETVSRVRGLMALEKERTGPRSGEMRNWLIFQEAVGKRSYDLNSGIIFGTRKQHLASSGPGAGGVKRGQRTGRERGLALPKLNQPSSCSLPTRVSPVPPDFSPPPTPPPCTEVDCVL